MLWNAFVWGLGVSCGGGIGLIACAFTMRALDWATGKADRIASVIERDVRSLEALQTRNELTKETNSALASIAVSLKRPGIDL